MSLKRGRSRERPTLSRAKPADHTEPISEDERKRRNALLRQQLEADEKRTRQ